MNTPATTTTISPFAAALQSVKTRLNGLPSTPSAHDAAHTIEGRLKAFQERIALLQEDQREVHALMAELAKLDKQRSAEILDLAHTINTLLQAKAALDSVSV